MALKGYGLPPTDSPPPRLLPTPLHCLPCVSWLPLTLWGRAGAGQRWARVPERQWACNKQGGGGERDLPADARFDLQLHLIVALFDDANDDDVACNMPLLLIAALVPQAHTHTYVYTETHTRWGY